MRKFNNKFRNNGTEMIKYCLFTFCFIFICGNIVILPASVSAEESTRQEQLYSLKAKLKIKDTFDNYYWGGKEKIDWGEEIKNWHYGFLPAENSAAPMVAFKDNLFPEYDFYWVHNRAKLLIINPLASDVITDVVFSAAALNKDTKLFVYINGKFKEKIVVPKRPDYTTLSTKFIIKDVVLKSGKNEIIFYDSITNPRSKHSPKSRDLFVQLKEDIKFEIKSLGMPSYTAVSTKPTYALQDDMLKLLFFQDRSESNDLFLMDRELDINLQEYPYFNLTYELQDGSSYYKKLNVFFGVDYNNDGKVDGYLNPQSTADVNLLELAMEKRKNDDWNYYSSFVLKRIFFVCYDKDVDGENMDVELGLEKKTDNHFEKYFFKLNLIDFNFYSNKAIITTLAKYKAADFKVDKVNCDYYGVFFRDQDFIASVYFNSGNTSEENNYIPQPSENKQNKSFLMKSEYIELKLPINIADSNKDEQCYFAFWFGLQDEKVQGVNIFLGLDSDGDGIVDKRVPVKKEKSIDFLAEETFQKIIIDLNQSAPNIQKIKQVIFQLYKKTGISQDGWYNFYFKDDIKIFRRYPAVINNKFKDSILNDLESSEIPVLSIDDNVLKFSQIKNKAWDIFENDLADFGTLYLKKGKYRINLLDNDTFKIEWAQLEPTASINKTEFLAPEPQIIFKKINPTKYIVQVKGAGNPFWLVFLESFHPQWKIYLSKEAPAGNDIVKENKNLGVKEARFRLKFNPFDLKYIFSKPLTGKHFLVNFYANGWYIEPKNLNLPEDFTLVLCFWPQFLFNIGLTIAGFTFILCIIYLMLYRFISKNNQ